MQILSSTRMLSLSIAKDQLLKSILTLNLLVSLILDLLVSFALSLEYYDAFALNSVVTQ